MFSGQNSAASLRTGRPNIEIFVETEVLKVTVVERPVIERSTTVTFSTSVSTNISMFGRPVLS